MSFMQNKFLKIFFSLIPLTSFTFTASICRSPQCAKDPGFQIDNDLFELPPPAVDLDSDDEKDYICETSLLKLRNPFLETKKKANRIVKGSFMAM